MSTVIAETSVTVDDVAGATFMAAGSSAPELAVAVVSTLLASEPGRVRVRVRLGLG